MGSLILGAQGRLQVGAKLGGEFGGRSGPAGEPSEGEYGDVVVLANVDGSLSGVRSVGPCGGYSEAYAGDRNI
jgi:hypothetical protein